MCVRCHNKRIEESIEQANLNEEKEWNKEVNIRLLKLGVKWIVFFGICYLILENFGDRGLGIAACIAAFTAIIYFLLIAPDTHSGNDGL